MANSLIPYSFIPGTKAMASEVNANFIALAGAVEEGKTFTTDSIEKFNKELETRLDESLDDKLEADFSNSVNISNCVLEVPDNIKYEINSAGRIILKKGSTVYVSTNGTFEALTLDADTADGAGQQWTTDHSRRLLAVYVPSTNRVISLGLDYAYSQSNKPTTFLAGYALWYDTVNKIMKITLDSGASWQICSLPIMAGRPGETNVGWRGYIDNVFNGMGFFAQQTFTLPGLKCLFADGRNADGTLKNTLVENKVVNIQSIANQTSWIGFFGVVSGSIMLGGYGVRNYFEQDNAPKFNGTHATWYNTRENYLNVTSDGGETWSRIHRIMLPNLTKSSISANITELSGIYTLKLANAYDLANSLYMPVSKGTNGYTKLQNGIIIQWGRYTAGSDGETRTITFPTAFSNTAYSVAITQDSMGGDWYNAWYYAVSARGTTSMNVYARFNYCSFNWIAIGY